MKYIILLTLCSCLKAFAISHVSELDQYSEHDWKGIGVNYDGLYVALENDSTSFSRVLITSYGEDLEGAPIRMLSMCFVWVGDVAAKPEYNVKDGIVVNQQGTFKSKKRIGWKFVILKHKKTGEQFHALKIGKEYNLKQKKM